MELEGQRIAVTRPADGNDQLVELLRSAGAEVVAVPLIHAVPPADSAPLRRAAAQLDTYDWIVFTSAAGVRALGATQPRSARSPRTRIAAVGSATASAVAERFGWPVHAVPEEFSGAGLCAAMEAVAPVAGAAVLWPRADAARPELGHALHAAGALLDAPEAYHTELLPDAASSLLHMAKAGALTAITLTSPSAATVLAAAGQLPPAVVIAVIGPSTGRAARTLGMTVHVEAAEHTAAGLVTDLIEYFRTTPPRTEDG
jgi:uroporphyrinogen-III synthase